MLLCFEIGEESDLFKLMDVEVLRLVDDDGHIIALARLFKKKRIEAFDQFELVGCFMIGNAEIAQNELKQLDIGKTGIEDEGRFDLLVQTVQQRAA